MKLLLALFVVTNLSYSMADSNSEIDAELNNIVLKYKYLAMGNAEFSQWVERIYSISRKRGQYSEKMSMIRNFRAYDAQRQRGEDQIYARIYELESLLMNRDLTLECRSDYLTQKSILSKAFKFSNDKKSSILQANSRKCNKVKKKKEKEESSYYDYSYFWNWLLG